MIVPPPDPSVTRTALRKASHRLIPLIAVGYCVAYMDRVNISFAALQMNRDLHFSESVYGFGAGLFFLSYAALEVPSNLLLYKVGARRWLSRIMVTWGLLAMCMLFVRTPTHFYVMRLLLGAAEAGFFPGIIFYLMQWFPPELRARTVSRFYISLPLSSVIMGSLAGALLNLQGRLGLAGWQWLFLLEGLPAVILGGVFFLSLPDSPADAAWLTPRERDAILAAIPTHPNPGESSLRALALSLLDTRVLLLAVFFLCMLASLYAYTFSGPALLAASTHLSPANIGFLLAAMNLVGAAAMILNAMHSDRTRDRFLHIIPFCLLMLAGFVAAGLSNSATVVIPALAVIILGFNAMQGPLWAMPASFLSGRSAAAGIAAMNTIGIIGGVIAPWWMGFAREHTGSYQRGLLVMSLPMLACTVIMVTLRHQQQASTIVVSQAPEPANL